MCQNHIRAQCAIATSMQTYCQANISYYAQIAVREFAKSRLCVKIILETKKRPSNKRKRTVKYIFRATHKLLPKISKIQIIVKKQSLSPMRNRKNYTNALSSKCFIRRKSCLPKTSQLKHICSNRYIRNV